MIPSSWRFEISCDYTGCSNHKSIVLETDAVENDGLDCAIEGALIESGWAVRYPVTFCSECVERILNETLAHYADSSCRMTVKTTIPDAIPEGSE